MPLTRRCAIWCGHGRPRFGFWSKRDNICKASCYAMSGFTAGPRAWTLDYRRWLTTVRFDHPAQQIVLQDYIDAVEDAEARRDRLTRQIEELLPSWSMAPVVKALQAMRGVALVVAVTIVAEVGDFRRFANARQLMAYLGLVPSEHSSGSTIRRGGITKAGNALARRVLIEGAWTYRMQARVSRKLHDRLEPLSTEIRDIAWKAQVRLCTRYRRLAALGKPSVVATTAIAREMVGFIWAIARRVQSAVEDQRTHSAHAEAPMLTAAAKPCGFAAALGRR